MNPDALLFNLALFLYAVASVGYHLHLFGRAETGGERRRRWALAAVIAGVLAHTAAIGVFCVNHGSVFKGAMPFSLVAYFLALGQIAAHFAGWSALGALVMPLAFVTEFAAGTGPAAAGHQQPGNALLRPHVTVLLIGFTAFALAFCLAVLYLVEARLLKEKRIKGFDRLPPLESVSTAAHWLAVIGFSMLTLGVITGAMAAPQSWGPEWYTNPRLLPGVVTSLVAWIIYAGYLAASMFLGWRGRRTTYFLIAGFLVVLVALFASVSGRKSPETVGAPHARRLSHP